MGADRELGLMQTEAIPIGLLLSGEELRALQKLSAQHVTFSLTEACPLRCAHCIVATVPVADKSRTMPLTRAEAYAAQMPDLTRRGVRFISFTGGEPLLARRQLAGLSTAAAAAGADVTVVTSAHWATSPQAAARVVASLPGIRYWHLSTDIYHTAFVSLERVIWAANAAREAGRQVMIRLTVPNEPTEKCLELHRALSEALPDVPIFGQNVIGMGRAAESAEHGPISTAGRSWPCIPNSMVVRFDGSIGPCCAGLFDTREGHPFQYPNADDIGLDGAHRAWCADPLLQLIRAAGFDAIMGWLEEIAPDNAIVADPPDHPCDFCVRLWDDPRIGAALRERAGRSENRRKIAELTRIVFNETFMTDEAPRPEAAEVAAESARGCN
jgi:pyruvate-formate lyase-activating enzyme